MSRSNIEIREYFRRRHKAKKGKEADSDDPYYKPKPKIKPDDFKLNPDEPKLSKEAEYGRRDKHGGGVKDLTPYHAILKVRRELNHVSLR